MAISGMKHGFSKKFCGKFRIFFQNRKKLLRAKKIHILPVWTLRNIDNSEHVFWLFYNTGLLRGGEYIKIRFSIIYFIECSLKLLSRQPSLKPIKSRLTISSLYWTPNNSFWAWTGLSPAAIKNLYSKTVMEGLP